MTRSGLAAAALLTTAAAWLSQGTLAVSSLDGSRIGLLPLSPFAWVTALAAGAAVAGFARAGASLAPIWLLAFIVFPWLPLPVPAAFLVWSGPIRWLIWTAVATAMVVTVVADRDRRRRLAQRFPVLVALVRDRPRSMAGALAFAIFAFAAWQVSPSVPGGDEPHYLVITQSLLLDGDLKIENNHSARRLPGLLRRTTGAPLRPPWRERRDLFHSRPWCVRARRSGICGWRIPRRCAVPARDRRVRQRARMARCLAGVWAAVGGLVRMGGGHAVGDDHLSQFRRLSRCGRRSDRADRSVGAPARGRRAQNR